MNIVASNQNTLDEAVRAQLQPELEVLRRLGTGSTADVYLAREPALQRLVAVKVLKQTIASDWSLRRRFEREAQSAARIRHPNVTVIYRVGRLQDDVPYLVMEYIDGRHMRDAMASNGPFSVIETKRILADVALALSAAHLNGVIHRDIRPENVFLEKQSDRAVLADFGLAGLLDTGIGEHTRLTAPGLLLGDVRYMSPERISGDAASEQSDIYSLGVMALEMLTGKADALAWAGELPDIVLRDLHQIDANFATLVTRCLSRNPQQRPLARELANALSAEAHGHEPPGALLDQLLAELRHRRVFSVLLAYSAFSAGVIGFGADVFAAFDVSNDVYRTFVLATLAGLPVVIVLSWVFDFRRGRIERTHRPQASGRTAVVMWGTLAVVIVAVAVAGWLLTR